MTFLTEAARWFQDPVQWHGSGSIPVRVWEHLVLSVPPLLLAAAIAMPVGVIVGHRRRGGLAVISVANIGRAMPSFAVLVLAVSISIRFGLGLSYWPAFVALFALALPPILTNTFTGVKEADPAVVEAARGLGLDERQVVLDVEVPLGMPVILAGLRVSAVQVVATATLAALAGGGGLGRYIIDGLATQDVPQVFGGAVLVALLSVGTEAAFGLVERVMVPPPIRRVTRDAPITDEPLQV